MPEPQRRDDLFIKFLLAVCVLLFGAAGTGSWVLASRVTALEVKMEGLREGQAEVKDAVKKNATEISALRRELDHR